MTRIAFSGSDDGDLGTGLRLLGSGASQHHGAEVPRLVTLPDRASESGPNAPLDTSLMSTGERRSSARRLWRRVMADALPPTRGAVPAVRGL